MLNTKKLLTYILTRFIVVGDLVTSSTATVAANAGTHEFSLDMTKANYKPIAVASLGKSGGANGQLAISHWYFSGNTLRVTIVNNTSTARTISVEARALYVGGVVNKLLAALTLGRGWSCA